MKIGVVIGTYGATPYIHLQLESRRKYWPNIPVLVVDDHSPENNLLKGLCDHYGASFVQAEERLGHTNGDLNVFAEGLKWAKDNKLDYIIKLSRRFIFLTNWEELLQAFIELTGYAETYSNTCNLKIRTECMIMKVDSWSKVLNTLDKSIQDKNVWTLKTRDGKVVEFFLHDLCQKVGRIEYWSFLSPDRWEISNNYLWHFGRGWMPYYDLGISWGLKYKAEFYQKLNGVEGHKF